MTLMECVGARVPCSTLQAVDEAVRECDTGRLRALLTGGALSTRHLDHRSVLHRAVWLGHTPCVRLLLEQGVRPDEPHRKNGCTPLHLAHFCTIDDSNPERTIRTLVEAGADINNPGSNKCGKLALDHAIQHQRLDSVKALLNHGYLSIFALVQSAGPHAGEYLLIKNRTTPLGKQAQIKNKLVSLQSVHISIDVANPGILELLLIHGADCGLCLETTRYWGKPLQQALYLPLKCPRECYKVMFRLLVQSTVCHPLYYNKCRRVSSERITDCSLNHEMTPAVSSSTSTTSSLAATLDAELKSIAKDHLDVANYLYACLVRNGFHPSETTRKYMAGRSTGLDWVERYLKDPPPLQDLTVRVLRSHLYSSGNITHGVKRLNVPARLRDFILMVHPL